MRGTSCRGFSIVELMVVLGLILILIALALPSLSSVRGEARQRVCQSEMHQLSIMIVAYSTNSRDMFPFPLQPTDDGNFIYPRSGLRLNPLGAMGMAGYWPVSMFDEFDNSMYSDILLCPDDTLSLPTRSWVARLRNIPEAEVQGPAVRMLSQSLYADPAALSMDRTEWEDWFLKINTFHDIIFASQKALLVEIEPFHEPGYYATKAIPNFRLMVSATDGSAAWRSSSDATPALSLGMAEGYGLNPDDIDPRLSPFQLCRDGVHGRDW